MLYNILLYNSENVKSALDMSGSLFYFENPVKKESDNSPHISVLVFTGKMRL